jgi:sugar lactone lactonase YvrE
MRRARLAWLTIALSLAGSILPSGILAADLATDRPAGTLEVVATFGEPMPTGVTVSHSERVYVCFPRWGDRVDFKVAEVKNGRVVAYLSSTLNTPEPGHAAERLISVQSVVVDPKDRLWIVDTGSVQLGPTSPGGPKLVGVDLEKGAVFQTITFPEDVALRTTYLNDVRFDLRRGGAGFAFLTDSSDQGPNGLIVVDLASGQSWRRLHDHPSTKADRRSKWLLPREDGPGKTHQGFPDS